FFERGLERDVDVKIPRFAEDRHDRRFGGEQSLDYGVVSREGVRSPRAAERGERRGVQPQRLRALEKLHVLWIRAGPAAFAKGDADLVQGSRYLELVLDRVGQPFTLRAVAQRRVVNFYNGLFHFSFSLCPRFCSRPATASNHGAASRHLRSGVSFRFPPGG